MEKQKKEDTTRIEIFGFGILVGVLAIIFGIITRAADIGLGTWVNSSIKFGTEYYTETYHAMATTANNIRQLAEILEIVKNAIGYLLIAIGLAIILLSIVFNYIERNRKNKVNNDKLLAQTDNASDNMQNEILAIKNLYDSGLITEQEYEAKKKEILGI